MCTTVLIIFLLTNLHYSTALKCYQCKAPCDFPSSTHVCQVSEEGGCVTEKFSTGIGRDCVSKGEDRADICSQFFSRNGYKCAVCNSKNLCNDAVDVLEKFNSYDKQFNFRRAALGDLLASEFLASSTEDLRINLTFLLILLINFITQNYF